MCLKCVVCLDYLSVLMQLKQIFFANFPLPSEILFCFSWTSRFPWVCADSLGFLHLKGTVCMFWAVLTFLLLIWVLCIMLPSSCQGAEFPAEIPSPKREVWSSASDSSFSLVLAISGDSEAAKLCFYPVPLLLQHSLRSTWSRRLKKYLEVGLGPLKEAHREWRGFTWFLLVFFSHFPLT